MLFLTRSFRAVGLLLICTTALMAQHTVSLHSSNSDRAVDEIESVLSELPKVDTAFAKVVIKAKSASLLSFRDPVRAEALFIETWKFAKEQSDSGFDKDRALNTILKYVYPRNAKLAKQLLSEELGVETKGENGPLTSDNNRKLARLSAELIDSDPVTASTMLERHLAQGITPAGIGALQRLREKDPLLSDYVVSRTLEHFYAAPTSLSLGGLYLLNSYVFPESHIFAVSPSLQLALEALQFRYFSISYDVLKRSLAEDEANKQTSASSPPSPRSINQAQMAILLAALSSRYQPSLVREASALASKLSASLPPKLMQLAQFTSARLSNQPSRTENPEVAFALALAKGDFQEADLLISRLKTEDQRNAFSQMLVKTQAKSALKGDRVEDALSFIRRVENADARLVLYIEACAAAYKKRDKTVSRAIVAETRSLIPQTGKNGLHIRALLSLSSQLVLMESRDEAAELLDLAIVGLNALKSDSVVSAKTALDAAWNELNDPQSLLSAPELERAFMSLGALDLDRALGEAIKIKDRSIRLVSRLESVQRLIRQQMPKTITVPEGPPTSGNTRN